jgi:hypothetical protein
MLFTLEIRFFEQFIRDMRNSDRNNAHNRKNPDRVGNILVQSRDRIKFENHQWQLMP